LPIANCRSSFCIHHFGGPVPAPIALIHISSFIIHHSAFIIRLACPSSSNRQLAIGNIHTFNAYSLVFGVTEKDFSDPRFTNACSAEY